MEELWDGHLLLAAYLSHSPGDPPYSVCPEAPQPLLTNMYVCTHPTSFGCNNGPGLQQLVCHSGARHCLKLAKQRFLYYQQFNSNSHKIRMQPYVVALSLQ